MIAKAITGTNWNGWTFFGVKRSSGSEGRDSLGRFRQPAMSPDGSRLWPRSRRTKPADLAPVGGEGADA